MKKILPTDIIFATVIQRGKTLASVRIVGASTLTDIMNYLGSILKEAMGLVTFKLRNTSQGWNHERSVMLCPSGVR
ncbi:MAG: hypothetical protein J1E95_11770 [Muribaculaceae bacterium]|nr:hypothetical protein [Muribaculaceae bacterium]